MTAIHPSILNCDIAHLADEIDRVTGADGADGIHVDVMDNHFVPNLSWGLPVVEAVLAHTTLPVDAHLMIRDADRWAPAYAEAGCQIVTPHAEATTAPGRPPPPRPPPPPPARPPAPPRAARRHTATGAWIAGWCRYPSEASMSSMEYSKREGAFLKRSLGKG